MQIRAGFLEAFHQLERDDLRQIIDLEIDKVSTRLKRHEIKLLWVDQPISVHRERFEAMRRVLHETLETQGIPLLERSRDGLLKLGFTDTTNQLQALIDRFGGDQSGRE